ncbi:MAG: arylesterase [Chthoniobacteraceae bacterium]
MLHFSFRLTASWILALGMVLGLRGALWADDSDPANAAAVHRGRIVVLGDSITAGYGLDPSDAYPARLQDKIDASELPFAVVNAGVSGDTTAGGLRRVNWALANGADVLIVALGGNDGLRGISPDQTAKNLRGIVEKARGKSPGIEVILTGMQMPGNMGQDYVEKFRDLFPAVAKETKARLIPFLLEGVGGDAQLNQPDRIHPNAEGQKIVAANVWRGLEPVLRKRMPAASAAGP